MLPLSLRKTPSTNSSGGLRASLVPVIVWIRGYDCYLFCLSEELIRAGLVEIDDVSWQGYTFMVPTKAGKGIADWRGILRDAKEGHARGEKLRVPFAWPPN
jgi:hypothetical protein